jgi:uncharacterized protein (DUF1810 family)
MLRGADEAKFIRHDILRRVVKACIDALEQISGGVLREGM